MDWPKIWYGDSPWLRTLLTPLSWLYALGWQGYRALYDSGLKKAARPYPRILCVGNLTVGGSGKTPVTFHITTVLASMGYEVVLGMSGYGGPHSEAAAFAPSGPLLASEWGDEPALARLLLPTFPLIVGRRRVLAAELMASRYPSGEAVLLMDDGFQHLPLAKSASILLDPSSSNTRCLPAGPYREPRSNLRRADLVIPPPPSPLPATQTFAERGSPERYHISSQIAGWTNLAGAEVNAPKEANVLCAIGRPQPFADAVATSGVVLKTTRFLPDHDPLSAGNLFSSLEGPTIVTAKDAVKLRERPDATALNIIVARHEVTIEPAEAFRNFLRTTLETHGSP